MDHYTYVLASDGDLMEGVAAEAASLAGTLRLGRLIVLYDANLITLSATTNLTFTEDVGARFEAYGWHVQRIDGQDPTAVDAALTVARAVEDRPSLIVARTHIGYGSPHKQDTWHAHGEPLGVEEVRLTKRALGWPEDRTFLCAGGCAARVSNVHRARRRPGSGVATPHGRVSASRIPAWPTSLRTRSPASSRDGWETHLPIFTPGGRGDGHARRRGSGRSTRWPAS